MDSEDISWYELFYKMQDAIQREPGELLYWFTPESKIEDKLAEIKSRVIPEYDNEEYHRIWYMSEETATQ